MNELVRNISNSEVTAFLTCKRQYNYAFGYTLEPKTIQTPLERGTLGHLAFSTYIEARLNGSNHDAAMQSASGVFIAAMKEGRLPPDLIMETQFLFNRYQSVHNGWPEWKLLGTEERVDLELTPTINLPIRYDLLVEEVRTNKVLIGDFKFTYDFWSADDHDLNPQAPKYVAVLQANNIKCDGAFLEEIRTRPLGKEKSSDHKNLWRRTRYFPSLAKKRNVLRQHVQTSLEIQAFRALSEEERRKTAIPVLNKHGACKYCNFKSLCNSENEGKKDLTLDMQVDYQNNSYGYNHEPDLMKLEELF